MVLASASRSAASVTRRRLTKVLRRPAALWALIVAAIIFAIDIALPLGVAGGVPYVAVILIALNARSPRFVVFAACGCSVLTLLDIVFSAGPGGTEWWKVIANRGLALFAIWVTTILGQQRNRADDDRRRHLDDLAHLNRVQTVEHLATTLAHELNQPLTAISLQADVASQLLELASSPSTSMPQLRPALTEIAEQSQRASGIIRTLRRFVRKAPTERVEVSMNDVIRDVLSWIEPLARQAGIELRAELAQQLPSSNVDRVLIEQVLINLIGNAIDALSSSSVDQRFIKLQTRFEAGAVRVCVSDSGPGVPIELHERLFQSFVTSKPQGMGLGLAICRSIIKEHGGELWFEAAPNDAGDPGAVFTFTLPQPTSS